MGLMGMDVDQAGRLVSILEAKQQELEAVIKQMTAIINQSNAIWRGHDADSFRADWSGQHLGQLREVVATLHKANTDMVANIAAQRNASR